MSNQITTFFVPSSASEVRLSVEQAALLSHSPHFTDAHLLATAYAIKALACSLFNSFSYLIESALEIIEGVVELRFWKILSGVAEGLSNICQSVALVVLLALGTLLALIFPKLYRAFEPISEKPKFISPPSPPAPPPLTLPPPLPLILTPEAQADLDQLHSCLTPVHHVQAPDARVVPDHSPSPEKPCPEKRCPDLHPIPAAPAPTPPPPLSANATPPQIFSAHAAAGAPNHFSPSPDPSITPPPQASPVSLSPPLLEVENPNGASPRRFSAQAGAAAAAARDEALEDGFVYVEEEEEEFIEITSDDALKLPKGCLVAYVQQFCSGYEEVYEGLIAQGKAFSDLFKVYPKEDPRSPENIYAPQERRALGAPFIWYQMERSQKEQGKAFGEGTFSIEDPDYRIHDFFAAIATKRASTHFKKTRLTSYGMDIVQDYRTGLPGGHQTMHFGKRLTLDPTKQFTFFKPESWGTESFRQMAGHAGSYLLSLGTHAMGHTTQVGQYKEHTTKTIRNAFLKLIAMIAPEERKPKIVQWGLIGVMDYLRSFFKNETPPILEEWGVAGIALFLRDFMKANPTTPHRGEIEKFVDTHLKNYNEIQVRQGEEVILRAQAAHQSGVRLGLYEELKVLLKETTVRVLPPSEVDFKAPNS